MTQANGEATHSEGRETSAEGYNSHAEGYMSQAFGDYSHAEGGMTNALGEASHAEGVMTRAIGACSHASGVMTEAYSHCMFVTGVANMVKHSDPHMRYDLFVIGNGDEYSDHRSNAFRVTYDGDVFAQQAFNTGGADYAEWFEWLDGNPDKQERLGIFVTLDGEMVRPATESDDYILGVVTTNPSVVGNSDTGQWHGMYIKDEWGRVVHHEVEVDRNKIMNPRNVPETIKTRINEFHNDTKARMATMKDEIDKRIEEYNAKLEAKNIPDELKIHMTNVQAANINIAPAMFDTKPQLEPDMVKQMVRKVNPDYDPNREFIPRDQRPEWVQIGMLGQLYVYDDGTCEVNGYCKPNEDGIATASDTGYRVMSKKNGLVKIIFR